MGEHSAVVAEGMKRVCSAFTKIAKPFGFRRGNGRVWSRRNGSREEVIRLFRHGSTYGAPVTPSIDLRVILFVDEDAEGAETTRKQLWSDKLRRPTGYCYHHRFNAQTGSTYDRCLEELELFLYEVAEPWFAEQRDAAR